MMSLSMPFDSLLPIKCVKGPVYHLSQPPKHAKKEKRGLSSLLAIIIQLRKHDLLQLLLEPFLEHDVSVSGLAVKEAVALH